MRAARHRPRLEQLVSASLGDPHPQPGAMGQEDRPPASQGQKGTVCRGSRCFQSPEPAKRQSWKEGQPLRCFVGKHSREASWEQFHTKTSALQCCCCWRESCWSYVNLKLGSLRNCQMRICGSLIHSRQGWGYARETVGRKVLCIEYQVSGSELSNLHPSPHLILIVILGSISPSLPGITLNLRQRE